MYHNYWAWSLINTNLISQQSAEDVIILSLIILVRYNLLRRGWSEQSRSMEVMSAVCRCMRIVATGFDDASRYWPMHHRAWQSQSPIQAACEIFFLLQFPAISAVSYPDSQTPRLPGLQTPRPPESQARHSHTIL
jgi:hypothetical protein